MIATFLPLVLWLPPILADLSGLPTVPFTSVPGKPFDISSVESIVIDSQYASARDEEGWTLIPPTLAEFAGTFASDLHEVLGVKTEVVQETSAAHGSIFLTVRNSSDFTDAAGRWTSEGYTLNVTDNGITLIGASPLGAWWGTRTVLQQAILNRGKLTLGSGTDSPGWNTRGLFIDDGRHYYPPEFLVEHCTWQSFWKQNIFHIHLSDNLYDNYDLYDAETQMEIYARFRPWSDDPAVAGLNKHRNESFTKEDFDYIQSACAARGVTIIPEIESPGHALVISQWKPELALEGTLDLLNITYPNTIPTVESIWSTFLPWFHTKVVHIGADEYVDASLSSYELAQDYNHFVNTMNDHIATESGKGMRIWGTYPPQANYTDNINKSVTVQHWEYFEDNPLFDYIANGINVINSNDATYIVNKYSASYPQTLNRTLMFHGNPVDDGPFAPYIFDNNNATNNPARDNPYVVGHIACLWNDFGYNTSTYLEAYYSWRDLNPALADKQWGGKVTDDEYDALFAALQPSAPGQNLDRTIPSTSSTILQYDFANTRYHKRSPSSAKVQDLSGNDYTGTTNCSITDGAVQFHNGCTVQTPLTSKGRNYTLSFTVKQSASSPPGPLFTGPDSELRSGNGSSTQAMLVTSGYAFALNYSLPLDTWTQVDLIGRGNQTFLAVNGGTEMEFTTEIGVDGEYFVWREMSIVAPLQVIGGGAWDGAMAGVKLVDYA